MFATLSDHKNTTEILNSHLNWQDKNEANLHNSVIQEYIRNQGIEVRYIRRQMNNPDFIFGEDSTNEFTDAFRVSVYLESFEKYQGQGQMFNNFGYQMKDEAEFLLSVDQFKLQADNEEPLEGDLVYIPMTNALFEIKFIDAEEFFYQFGELPVRRLLCQKFTYSHEQIDSSVVDEEEGTVDIIEQLKDLNELSDFDTSEQTQVEQEDGFVEFDPNDPFGNGYGDIR